MEELRKRIGNNLAELRKNKGLTQLELADKFAYTDRAVSKWENGDTLPDIEVLYNLCEFYGVTIDYLTHEDNKRFVKDKNQLLSKGQQISITALVISIVYFIATVVFVWSIIKENQYVLWESFLWAVPISCLVLEQFNRHYFRNRILAFITYSIFIWSTLISIYFTWLDYNIWALFILGVPAQASLIIWLNIRKTFSKKDEESE